MGGIGNIMAFSFSRTGGSVIYRSTGGVKCNYDPVISVVYDYYPSQTKYVTINMSDFYGWTTGITGNIATAYNFSAYTNVGLPLRNAENGVLIGAITKTARCFPKMMVYDAIDNVITLRNFSSCTTHLTELGTAITQNYLDVTPPQSGPTIHQGPIRLSAISSYIKPAVGSGPYSAGSCTKALHAEIYGNYYLYPGTATRGIVRIGDDFFPLKIAVNIDLDINDWYQGKFVDETWNYILPGTTTEYVMDIVRNGGTLQDAYATVTSHYFYTDLPFTMSYGSCYQNVSQSTLPISFV
jgi:hypothetical protein